jgi:adenosylcobinamide-GDP ribazoletransferase
LSFLAALQLLTSIPVSIKRQLTPAQLGKATTWFPVVGLLIGLVLALVHLALSLFLPASVVNALVIVTLVLLTGAMHLDGFADTCDGMAGHKPVEERWKIMHDSRTGAFGVVGIVLLLLVKYISLSNIPAQYMTAALVFMPVVSRWAMVYAIFTFRYARPEGFGKAYKEATRWPQFTIATIFTLVVVLCIMFIWLGIFGIITFLGIVICTTLIALHFRRKFAGQTGDTYGAINETSEVAALILIILLDHIGTGLTG